MLTRTALSPHTQAGLPAAGPSPFPEWLPDAVWAVTKPLEKLRKGSALVRLADADGVAGLRALLEHAAPETLPWPEDWAGGELSPLEVWVAMHALRQDRSVQVTARTHTHARTHARTTTTTATAPAPPLPVPSPTLL